MSEYAWIIQSTILVVSVATTGLGLAWYLSGRLTTIENTMAKAADVAALRERILKLEVEADHKQHHGRVRRRTLSADDPAAA